jgi:hypothetical protein
MVMMGLHFFGMDFHKGVNGISYLNPLILLLIIVGKFLILIKLYFCGIGSDHVTSIGLYRKKKKGKGLLSYVCFYIAYCVTL